MQNTEQLSLQWDDFKDNISSTFAELRGGKDFSDVTLVSEDGKQIETHKIILASSSPFFKNVLIKNKHQHPLIYMKGVKFDQLSSFVDFLYFGETRVDEENLETFLALADELKLKGLSSEGVEKEHIGNDRISRKSKKNSSPNPSFTKHAIEDEDEKAILLKQPISSLELSELDEQIESMTSATGKTESTRGGKIFACKVCGKEGSRKDLRRHIESKHISGIVHNCDICGKTTRSRDAMRQHKRSHL